MSRWERVPKQGGTCSVQCWLLLSRGVRNLWILSSRVLQLLSRLVLWHWQGKTFHNKSSVSCKNFYKQSSFSPLCSGWQKFKVSFENSHQFTSVYTILSPRLGASSCSSCPEGNACSGNGTSTPTPCSAGYVAPAESNTCTLCATSMSPDIIVCAT